MIAIPSGADIYLCTTATDMRKSFDGLSGIVRAEFGREPADGSLFLFINRRRDRLKILHWEEGGFVLCINVWKAEPLKPSVTMTASPLLRSMPQNCGDADLRYFSLVHQSPQTLPRRLGGRWRGTSGSEDGVLTAEIDFRAGDVIDW
jgi:hypothetical protein